MNIFLAHTTMAFSPRTSNKLLNTFRLILSCLILAVFLPTTVSAHRGALDEFDDCRIRVGSESVHFTAYTPTVTAGKEYCKTIPHLAPTNFVFDYEGRKLRHITVEFEITKEPEGTRIFYQAPEMIKTGSTDGLIDFSKYGAGDYLAHVTIIDKGEQLDTHLSFEVGNEEASYGWLTKLASVFAVFFLLLFFMIRKAKKNDAKSVSPAAQEESPDNEE